MALETGEVIAWLTGGTTVIVTIWTQFGKSRDTSWTRLEGERTRLEAKVADLENKQQAQAERLDKMEAELQTLKQAHNTLLDFLRDVVGDYFPDLPTLKRRASELLSRFGSDEYDHSTNHRPYSCRRPQ